MSYDGDEEEGDTALEQAEGHGEAGLGAQRHVEHAAGQYLDSGGSQRLVDPPLLLERSRDAREPAYSHAQLRFASRCGSSSRPSASGRPSTSSGAACFSR